MTAGPGAAAAGHRSTVLVFANVSSAACRLYGYPGVAALDAHDVQVAQATRTLNGYMGGSTTPPANVDIAVGGSASATVEALGFNPDGTACVEYAGLLVTPPDDTRSVKVTWSGAGCGSLAVHPVVPGTTGSQR